MNGICSASDCDRPATAKVLGVSQSGRTWGATCCDGCRDDIEAMISMLGFDLRPVEPLAS